MFYRLFFLIQILDIFTVMIKRNLIALYQIKEPKFRPKIKHLTEYNLFWTFNSTNYVCFKACSSASCIFLFFLSNSLVVYYLIERGSIQTYYLLWFLMFLMVIYLCLLAISWKWVYLHLMEWPVSSFMVIFTYKVLNVFGDSVIW